MVRVVTIPRCRSTQLRWKEKGFKIKRAREGNWKAFLEAAHLLSVPLTRPREAFNGCDERSSFSPANGLPRDLAYAVILALNVFHKREISPSNFGGVTKPILKRLRREGRSEF